MAGDLELARTSELQRVLLTLAFAGGSADRAAKMLRRDADNPLRITRPQLEGLRDSNQTLYARLAERHAREIEDVAIRTLREGMIGAFAGAIEAVDLARTELEQGVVKDPAKTGRDLAVTGALLADKLLVLTGRPNQIREQRSPDEILREITDRLREAHTVTDVDAEVVE